MRSDVGEVSAVVGAGVVALEADNPIRSVRQVGPAGLEVVVGVRVFLVTTARALAGAPVRLASNLFIVPIAEGAR